MSPRERVTRHLRAIHDAPQRSPWTYSVVGGLLVAFAGVMVFREPDQWKAWAGFGVVGLALLPGAIPFAVANLKPLVGLFKTYKGTGGDGGPSAPSSGDAP